jgi:hypothetical protein
LLSASSLFCLERFCEARLFSSLQCLILDSVETMFHWSHLWFGGWAEMLFELRIVIYWSGWLVCPKLTNCILWSEILKSMNQFFICALRVREFAKVIVLLIVCSVFVVNLIISFEGRIRVRVNAGCWDTSPVTVEVCRPEYAK